MRILARNQESHKRDAKNDSVVGLFRHFLTKIKDIAQDIQNINSKNFNLRSLAERSAINGQSPDKLGKTDK